MSATDLGGGVQVSTSVHMCMRTHVENIRDLPVSTSPVLELQAHATFLCVLLGGNADAQAYKADGHLAD